MNVIKTDWQLTEGVLYKGFSVKITMLGYTRLFC